MGRAMNIPTDLHEETSVDLEWCNLFKRQKDPRGLVHTIVCKGRPGKERWKASEHRQRGEPHPKAQGCRPVATQLCLHLHVTRTFILFIYLFWSHSEVLRSLSSEAVIQTWDFSEGCQDWDMLPPRGCTPSWYKTGPTSGHLGVIRRELTHRHKAHRMETEQGSLDSSHSWSQGTYAWIWQLSVIHFYLWLSSKKCELFSISFLKIIFY